MTFTVAATTGAEPLRYQWQLDDTNLVSSSEVSGITTNTLTINNVQENNEGMYRCVVTNDAGDTTSNAAQLTVCEWSWVAHQLLVIFRVCRCRNFSILVVHCSEPTYTRFMYVLTIDGFDGVWLSIQSIVLLRVAGLRPVKECLHCTPTSSDTGNTRRSFLSRQNVGCTAASSWLWLPSESGWFYPFENHS